MKRGATLWAAGAAVIMLMACVTAFGAPEQNGRTSLGRALKKTLLLFPFDVPSTTAPNADELSNLLTEVAGSRLIATGNYAVTTYYRAWPPVARLHNDQQLGEADVIPPFAEDNRKALKIGKLVGYDTVCVGSVDDYQYNEADKQVTMTVSARILVVETGQVLKNVTLSASSPKGGERAKEEELNVQAARQAMEKLMAQVAPVVSTTQTPIETAKPPAAKKKRSNDWLWGLLAIGLGLGIGLASGGGGGGGGIDTPPPPP